MDPTLFFGTIGTVLTTAIGVLFRALLQAKDRQVERAEVQVDTLLPAMSGLTDALKSVVHGDQSARDKLDQILALLQRHDEWTREWRRDNPATR